MPYCKEYNQKFPKATDSMWKNINDTVIKFRECFSREAAYKWFVIIVMGLMVRSDHLGVTSIIRELCIEPKQYENMLHFFRSSSWSIERLRERWISIVKNMGLAYKVYGQYLMIGDGVKEGKEGRKMPGVVKLCQESENSSKASYIQ